MKLKVALAGLLAMTTAPAFAGGFERQGLYISPLFENGNYAELSFGTLNGTVTGTFGGNPSGDVLPSYQTFGAAVKMDLNDQLSFALIFNQPYGATVEYTTPGYLLSGTSAHVYTNELAAVGRYKLNDAFSIHAGLRHITARGDLTLVFPGAYSTTYSRDSDTGWLIGAAYEKPEIALRAALTYASATHYSMAGTLGNGTATAPQSVTLDLQSG
ncbi:MAG: outer membrane protein transport protein, partial [Paracoccaceae bacterium]